MILTTFILALIASPSSADSNSFFSDCLISVCTSEPHEVDHSGKVWPRYCYHCSEGQDEVLFLREYSENTQSWSYVQSQSQTYEGRVLLPIFPCFKPELDSMGTLWTSWCYIKRLVEFEKIGDRVWTYKQDFQGGLPMLQYRRVIFNEVFKELAQKYKIDLKDSRNDRLEQHFAQVTGGKMSFDFNDEKFDGELEENNEGKEGIDDYNEEDEDYNEEYDDHYEDKEDYNLVIELSLDSDEVNESYNVENEIFNEDLIDGNEKMFEKIHEIIQGEKIRKLEQLKEKICTKTEHDSFDGKVVIREKENFQCRPLEGDQAGRYFFQEFSEDGTKLNFSKDLNGNFVLKPKDSKRVSDGFLDLVPAPNNSKTPCKVLDINGEILYLEPDIFVRDMYWTKDFLLGKVIKYKKIADEAERHNGMYFINPKTGKREPLY